MFELRRALPVLVIVILALVPLGISDSYYLHVAILTLLAVMLVSSLNLIVGYTGLLTFGHVAFYAIGAYTSGILMVKAGAPFLLAIPVAVLLSVVSGVSKDFGALRAVSQLEFEVRAGEICGIIGPNGAGKSTLFNLMTGLLSLSEGDVHICDRSIRTLRPHQIVQRGVTRTFQRSRVFGTMSLRDNVVIGFHAFEGALAWPALLRGRASEGKAHLQAEELLRFVGLGDRALQPASSLSHGQQRLLEVARAIATRPKAILLDEPAAGMNREEREHLAEILLKLKNDGVALCVIEHDLVFVRHLCERIMVMNYGTRIAEGPFSAIVSNPEVIQAYLGEELVQDVDD